MTNAALRGKPYAGNPHVRFDEGEVASAATPRRGSLLYRIQNLLFGILSTTCLAIVAGCKYDGVPNVHNSNVDPLYDFGYALGGRLDAYLKEVREVMSDEGFCSDPVVGSALTTKEYNSKYEVVYTDYERTFFSYRVESFTYTGGAHGNTVVGVGTIDVKTGKELKVADAIPKDKRAEALARVKAAVIKQIGGADNLQGEVTLTENFYVAEDGLHFVFNEYEVACYAQGQVEVVIPAYGKYSVHYAE